MANFFRAVSWHFIFISLTFFSIEMASPVVWSAQAEVPASPSSTVTSSDSSVALGRFQHWLAANGYSDEATKENNVSTKPSGGSTHVPTSVPPSSARPTTSVSVLSPQHKIVVPLATQRVLVPPHPIQSKVITHALSDEESRRIMLKSAPKGNILPENPDASTAFQNMLQQNMPLTPEQVIQLHQQVDIAQRAASIPANVPPKPVSTTLMINLAPGTTPPAIRLAQGYVSSLVFVDSTGMPWPIAALDVGNPKALQVQWDGKSNILLMQAIAPYSDGNMVVRLAGLGTPITLELVSGQRVVDYRADIHVSGIGPNSKGVPREGLPISATPLLLGVLDGVAPPGSRQLMVSGADCQAWLLNEKMYLRTRLTLLSPGWVGKMVSSDGMQAYELQKTSSVLVSRYGDPVELKIEGF